MIVALKMLLGAAGGAVIVLLVCMVVTGLSRQSKGETAYY